MSAAYQIAQFVDKMASPDKDFRFMAINDLMKELGTNALTMEEDSCHKVIRALLRLLHDGNGEVQNLAIRCIGMLAQPGRIKQHNLEYIIDELAPFLVSKMEMTRDIHALTIKSILQNLQPTMTPTNVAILKKLVPKLLDALQGTSMEDAAKIDVLDIIYELLKYGEMIPELHEAMNDVLSEQLSSGRQAIRKKATNAIGVLANVVNHQLYDKMVGSFIEKMIATTSEVNARSFVITIHAIAKNSGYKFVSHLSKTAPQLFKYIEKSEDDDLREACLQSLEAFLVHCPKEMTQYEPIMKKSFTSTIAYDPNYEYGDDDEEDEMELEEDDEDYSDDEDTTWKVRRSAAKAIEAMITSNKDSLPKHVEEMGMVLIARIKEREETVRIEIISAYIALLNQVALYIPDIQKAVVGNSDSDSDMITDDVVTIGNTQFSSNYLSTEQLSVIKSLAKQKDQLLKAVSKSLKRHPKTGPKCLELLTSLIKSYPSALDGNLDDLIPGVAKILTEKTATAQGKMTVIGFVNRAVSIADSKKFENLLESLTMVTTSAIHDQFYKVSAEGLVLATKYAAVLRKVNNGVSHMVKVFDVIEAKYYANDTDQEVREKAIVAVCCIMSMFKEELSAKIPQLLEKLTERISREMTCLVALRSSIAVISAGIQFNHQSISSILTCIETYLAKQARALRLACLEFLDVLLRHSETTLLPEEFTKVLGQLPSLINENDLQITNQTLNILTYSFKIAPERVDTHVDNIIDSIVKLLNSSLLQGIALTALQNLLHAMVISDYRSKYGFEKLLDAVTSPAYDNRNLSRQSHHAIASCAAVIAQATNDLTKNTSLAMKLAEQLQKQSTIESIRLFSMGTLGELGRLCPEVYSNNAQCTVKPHLLAVEAFNSSSEELKGAAAQALGALAVGNLKQYLPFILEQIKTHPKKQYLLLHALKEVIVWESADNSTSTDLFRNAIGDIWQMLMANAGGNEDGTRSVVAECLGRLCSFDPETLLPQLKIHVKSTDPVLRSAVVSAIKYMINNERKTSDGVLQKHIGEFLETVNDDDLKVRRVALVVLNSAVHNKSSLVRDILHDLVPSVYRETKMRKDLIREVEMGPFKHQVDEGLDLRKCAFECMYTLLENCVDKIDINQFLTVMEVGLADPSHDVKLLNYLTLQKMANLAPNQLIQRSDKICDALRLQLLLKARNNAVKQELEKIDELKKSVIRVIYMLRSKLPEIEKVQQYIELLSLIKQNKDLEAISDAVIRESQRAVVYDVPMDTA